ncbi:siroheme synthase [Sporolactobacillus sp. THM7-7]|nr:siroheme synthase [Sporolactobacillus sp. THM7-7]
MHYPITLDIRGRTAVVAGGGRVAERKIRSLISGGASVTVFCERASGQVEKWAKSGKIIWIRRDWSESDGKEAFLVIAATNDSSVNRQIAKQAGPYQLVNVADQPELGNFHLPAVLRRGKLTVAVSTEGASPLFARQLRDDIAEILDDDVEGYLDFLFQLRKALKERRMKADERLICLKKALDPVYRDQRYQDQVLADIDTFIRQSLAE